VHAVDSADAHKRQAKQEVTHQTIIKGIRSALSIKEESLLINRAERMLLLCCGTREKNSPLFDNFNQGREFFNHGKGEQHHRRELKQIGKKEEERDDISFLW